MTKQIHVLADETLGGTLREYVETNRKAEVGEKVLFNGQAYEVINRGTTLLQLSEHVYVDHYGTPALEPTDIVRLRDENDIERRYRLVDRKAEVGERVLIKYGAKYVNERNFGKVYEVVAEDGPTLVDTTGFYDDGSQLNLITGEYFVLVPVGSEQSPKNYDDIIANLVKRVAELERRDEEHRHVIERLGLDVSNVERNYGELFGDITGVKRDIETWAQEHEKTKRELDDKIEMCIDDIVTLDERTSESKNVAKSTVKVCDFSIRQSIDGETNVDVTFSGAPSAGNIAEAIRQALGGVRE